jgi:hypothetical protein
VSTAAAGDYADIAGALASIRLDLEGVRRKDGRGLQATLNEIKPRLESLADQLREVPGLKADVRQFALAKLGKDFEMVRESLGKLVNDQQSIHPDANHSARMQALRAALESLDRCVESFKRAGGTGGPPANGFLAAPAPAGGPPVPPAAPPAGADVELSFRTLRPRGGPLKPGPEAGPPVEPFWPVFTPTNTEAWDLGDPAAVSVTRQGVTVEAGAHGNFLLTKKSDYSKGALRIAVSVSEGAEAFLVLHGRMEAGEWRAITSRVVGERGTVRAGRLGTDFSVEETGAGAEGEPGAFLALRFEDDGRGRRAVFVGNKETATAAVGREGPATAAGAVGLFVKSGAVKVRNIDVR